MQKFKVSKSSGELVGGVMERPSVSIAEKQETIRGKLAIGFAVGYGVFILCFMAYFFLSTPTEVQSNAFNLILSTATGFVGTIIGFYFGQASKQ